MKDFFGGYGKIMTGQNYLIPQDAKDVISPTGEDLYDSEQLMTDMFVELVGNDESLKILEGKSYKKEYYDFYRQYAGFIDSKGHKIVVIHLLGCARSGGVRKCFPIGKRSL